MRRLILSVIAIVGLTCSVSIAEEMSPERQREVLREAQSAFDQAVELAHNQPERSQELYRQAVAGFSALIEAGVRNAALEYNLGNAYFRLNELGAAILHYARAQQLDPADQKIAANLEYARRQVEPAIERSGQTRLVRSLLFLHYDTALHGRFWAAVVLSVVGWFLLTLRLRLPRREFVITGGLAVGLALSFAASVIWQVREDARHPRAVLVGSPTILRLGRGEGYDPALQQPLGPGVEMRVLQQRGDWAEVRLPNDQTGWLPLAVLEAV